MSNLSYSFHISNNKNSIKNKNGIRRALNHNLRAFKSEERDKTLNNTLIGSNEPKIAFNEFREAYSNLFDEYVKDFNSKQKRNDRKIDDYFEKISKDKQTDMAVEIIIQVGDKEYWSNKSIEEKQEMNKIFKNQLDLLQKKLPNFKIVNATVHIDEASPHIQILGIPFEDFNKGLGRRVSKRNVFTKESLSKLQTEMRTDIEKQMNKIYKENIKINSKQKGRNKDLLIHEYKEIKEDQNQYKKKLQTEIEEELKTIKDTMKTYTETEKWYNINTIKKIDENKKIKRKNFFSNEKEIVLNEEEYSKLLTMGKNQSSQLTAWSNAYKNQKKEIEEKENLIKSKNTEIKELNNQVEEFSYKNKELKKELNNSNKFINFLKENIVKFLGDTVSNLIFKHIENKIDIDNKYGTWQKTKQVNEELEEDISFFNKIVQIKDNTLEKFKTDERNRLLNKKEKVINKEKDKTR